MSVAQEFLARFGYEVATHLSAIGQMRLWDVDEVSDTAIKLRGPDDMKIILWCVGAGLAPVKFQVSGEYPPDTFIMPKDKPKINVSYSRGARAVARDIERRFFSKYMPLYYEKLKVQQKIERGRAARERVMATLREAFDFKEARDRDGHLVRLERKDDWNEDSYGGKVDANLTTELRAETYGIPQRWGVSLKLENLTMAQALRIAEVLREPAFPTEQLRLM